MKHSIHFFILSALIISLTSCAYQPPKNVNSTYYAPPVGTTLQLHSAITMPANEAQVLIQYGKVVTSYWGVDAYYPNCNFELRNNAEVEQIIEPDTFTITRVTRDTENVRLHLPTMLASSGSGGAGPPNTDSITRMELRSDKQPEVMRMSCQKWDDPNEASHLSIEQIRQTLKPLFTLELPSR